MTAANRGRGRGGGRQYHLSPTHSSSSMHTCIDSSYAHGYSEYLAPNPSTIIYYVQWVYEWENPDFYNVLVSE
jgi:hypothetical protein